MVAAYLDEFLRFGFTGLGLIIWWYLGIISNVIISIIISIKKEEKATIKSITLFSLGFAILSVVYLLITSSENLAHIFLPLFWFFWIFYFIFIPQILIFLINKKILEIEFSKKNILIKKIILVSVRLILSIIFPILLNQLNFFIGYTILGISGF